MTFTGGLGYSGGGTGFGNLFSGGGGGTNFNQSLGGGFGGAAAAHNAPMGPGGMFGFMRDDAPWFKGLMGAGGGQGMGGLASALFGGGDVRQNPEDAYRWQLYQMLMANPPRQGGGLNLFPDQGVNSAGWRGGGYGQ